LAKACAAGAGLVVGKIVESVEEARARIEEFLP
jgi:hypothetical protein